MAQLAGACYGQPITVEAVASAPLKFGIFSVADWQTGDGPHWQQGAQWERDLCGPASTYRCPTCVENDGNTAPAKEYTEEGVPLESALPFTVYASFSCSPIGHWADAEDRARRALLSGEERAVEAMVADGVHTASRALYNASTVDITPTAGTPIDVVAGLALLEQYIGENGKGQGVILGSRRDVTLANANGVQIYQTGDELHTLLGTPVAALAGINGKTGPNGDAPEANEAWLFAIGSRPRIWRSDVFLTSDRESALNTSNNDLKILAERTYSVGWDCFTVGVLINSVGTA